MHHDDPPVEKAPSPDQTFWRFPSKRDDASKSQVTREVTDARPPRSQA